MKCTVIKGRIPRPGHDDCCTYGLMIEDTHSSYCIHDVSVDELFVRTIASFLELTDSDRDRVFRIIEACLP